MLRFSWQLDTCVCDKFTYLFDDSGKIHITLCVHFGKCTKRWRTAAVVHAQKKYLGKKSYLHGGTGKLRKTCADTVGHLTELLSSLQSSKKWLPTQRFDVRTADTSTDPATSCLTLMNA